MIVCTQKESNCQTRRSTRDLSKMIFSLTNFSARAVTALSLKMHFGAISNVNYNLINFEDNLCW